MKQKPLLLFIFIALFSVASFHFIALNFYFYWSLPWLDSLVHLASSSLVALFVLWFLRSFRLWKYLSSKKATFLIAFCSSLLVGIVWEIFEYSIGVTHVGKGNFGFDTATDIVMDGLGAVVAYLFWKSHIFSANLNYKMKRLR